MTRETLKRAIDIDQSIKNAESRMAELREAETLFRQYKDSGKFSVKMKTGTCMERSFDIPADVALEAIISANAKILEEKKRMDSIFKELH